MALSSFSSRGGLLSSRERVSPFECGFDSKQVGRRPFSLHFIVFLLVFLVFDVELVFFFHFPVLFSVGALYGLFCMLGVLGVV
jgi:NADH:ubiquinone oxidoreductase subunit 3 (subunit A)